MGRREGCRVLRHGCHHRNSDLEAGNACQRGEDTAAWLRRWWSLPCRNPSYRLATPRRRGVAWGVYQAGV